jgi:hypothetical protein
VTEHGWGGVHWGTGGFGSSARTARRAERTRQGRGRGGTQGEGGAGHVAAIAGLRLGEVSTRREEGRGERGQSTLKS